MHALLMLALAFASTQTAEQPPDGVYRPGSGVTLPRMTQEVRPQYTSDAMRDRIQGTVLLECVVLPDGTPSNIRVVRSLHPSLDEEAVKALRQWRFAPGTRDGTPVPVMISTEMTFTLGGPRNVPGAPVIVSRRTETDGSTVVFELSPERFRRLPVWNPLASAQPPLSAGDAIAIAYDWLRTVKPIAGSTEYELLSEALSRIGGRASDRWSYQLSFAPAEPLNGPPRTTTVVVLFDRTTIAPRVEKQP
jgi:TonB family protein